LHAAADVASAAEHRDAEPLTEHAGDVAARAEYLRTLQPGEERVPVEEHIRSVQLSINARGKPELVTPVGGVAIFGGVAGLIILGPLGAVVSAAAFAYAATRPGPVGDVSRRVGEVTSGVVSVAQRVGEEHRVQERFVSAFESTVETGRRASRKAQAFSERHQVPSRVVAAGSVVKQHAATATTTVTAMAERHRVSERVGTAAVATIGTVRKSVGTIDTKLGMSHAVRNWWGKPMLAAAPRSR
jgi:hypothetical protein